MYSLVVDLCSKDTEFASRLHKVCEDLYANYLTVPSVFDYKPDSESRVNKYVGIQNLGSTCYINSLIQIIFMQHELRNFIINCKIFDKGDESTELRYNLLHQLQDLFNILQFSSRKYIVPTEFIFSLKDENNINPIDVMQQQDVQEFLQIFFDRIISQINEINKCQSVDNGTNVFEQIVGGSIANQMIQGRQSDRHIVNQIRELEEPFYCLSLEVKGFKDLLSSLKKFVENEYIDDFSWEEGKPVENITKRQCISKLPSTLFLHLKRFEINFDTFR